MIPQHRVNKTMQQTHGHKPLVVNVVVVGPFEEEEEGTGIASDVVKVKGEDPATPGYYLRSVDTRKPRDCNDSPISGESNKAKHTNQEFKFIRTSICSFSCEIAVLDGNFDHKILLFRENPFHVTDPTFPDL